MSYEAPFPPAVPMPYLTPLFMTHIKDAASVRHHICSPLQLVWQITNRYIYENPVPDPVARGMWLARAKDYFTAEVYHSSASSELKRAMFELPLRDFFDTCIACFLGFNRGIIQAHEFPRWLAMCAMHPEADIDRSCYEMLNLYNMIQETVEYSSATPNDAAYSASISFCGHFPQMNDALEYMSRILGEAAYLSALQAFVQLGANVVDMFLYVYRTLAQTNVSESIIIEGLDCVTWAWQNMLDNPFGAIRPDARGFLVDLVDFGGLAAAMLRHIQSKVRFNSVGEDKLHGVMWTSILRYAASVPGMYDRTLESVIQNNLCLKADKKEKILAALADQLPEIERPIDTTDQVTAELSARVALMLNDNDEMRDVPIEAMGPAIDPRTLGHFVTESPTSDERCPVCRGEFADTEPFLALNACGHLFHVDCLDPWVNRVDVGLTRINCPYCRAQLCDARNYKGVVES
ncbi:hypothetical protein DE146DRAFT_732527 [Phaeosphaeria sp. MPI-PUGE-AT-0046c]|nr:hypothetical protein DE146DRAFT_732527 [Phaeosphaeria sp. MPI-PUGE-AT-0046c]